LIGSSLQRNLVREALGFLVAASLAAPPSLAAIPVDDPELARDLAIARDAAGKSGSDLDTGSISPDPSVYQDAEIPMDKPAAVAGKRASLPKPSRPARPSAKQKPAPKPKTSKPRTADIPAGCFWMGSPDGVGAANEHPRHRVCLDSFRMDRTPVSQKDFSGATKQSPWTLCTGPACAGPDPLAPAWFVTWTEADDFCHSRGGRLPTEAEFEYAARATDTGTYIWGDSASQACLYANLADLSLKKSLPTWKTFPCDDGEPLVARSGTRRPNGWGLFDMAGNIWEWAQDWYAADAYAASRERNPVGPDSGSGRVIRGGSWLSSPEGGRAAYRDGFQPEGRYTGSIGFRCVYPAR
jgi:formylglycine-generating enzyme required for sulfatase activity